VVLRTSEQTVSKSAGQLAADQRGTATFVEQQDHRANKPEEHGDRPWWLDAWVDAVERPAEMVSLDRAATLLSVHGLSQQTAAKGVRVIDDTVSELDRIAAEISEPTFAAVHRTLFDDLGLAGDREDYHAPRNSFLPIVLCRRRGIPISLAVVVMEVGRRKGIEVTGVGMPGHFLTSIELDDQTKWIDAFDHGRLLDLSAVESLHQTMFAGREHFDPERMLPEVDAHAMLTRMLANLKSSASFRRDLRSLADIVWMRQHLPGPTVVERREHVRLSITVGRFETARAGIDELARAVGADDPSVAEEQARFAAVLN
jgi:regulator of sirC expression with transglutaminase-like and TPR domain